MYEFPSKGSLDQEMSHNFERMASMAAYSHYGSAYPGTMASKNGFSYGMNGMGGLGATTGSVDLMHPAMGYQGKGHIEELSEEFKYVYMLIAILNAVQNGHGRFKTKAKLEKNTSHILSQPCVFELLDVFEIKHLSDIIFINTYKA